MNPNKKLPRNRVDFSVTFPKEVLRRLCRGHKEAHLVIQLASNGKVRYMHSITLSPYWDKADRNLSYNFHLAPPKRRKQ